MSRLEEVSGRQMQYTRSIEQAHNKQFYLIYAAEKYKGELRCLSVDVHASKDSVRCE